ncbi:MAG: hypothetical protein Q8N87_00345 [bacterium]|nr:hypothetical protein [bacterium]
MNKKITIFVIIVIAIFLIGISYYTGLNVGRQGVTPGTQKGTGANLGKMDSLLASEAIQWNLSANGIVKEISGRNLTVAGFTEEGKETASLVVPIAQEAKITSDYILPAGAAKEEIMGTISVAEGKEYNLGQKEISFEEIKAGDNVFISLNLKADYTIEGTEVRVSPADLIPAE